MDLKKAILSSWEIFTHLYLDERLEFMCQSKGKTVHFSVAIVLVEEQKVRLDCAAILCSQAEDVSHMCFSDWSFYFAAPSVFESVKSISGSFA